MAEPAPMTEIEETPGEEFDLAAPPEVEEEEEAPPASEEEAPPAAAEEEPPAGEEEEPPPVAEEDPRDKELSELRSFARQQHKQIQELQAQMGQHGKALKDNQLMPQPEDGEEAQVEDRGPFLRQLVTMMEVNPKFEDVREVCSQDHFNDTFLLMAKQYIEENGDPGDGVQGVADQIEAYVWSLDNPYAVMYDRIKELHPSYRQAPDAGKPPVAAVVDGKKGNEPPQPKNNEAPPSLSTLPPGGAQTAGWTAKKIDDMPEDELDKVPAQVYDAYLRGELK